MFREDVRRVTAAKTTRRSGDRPSRRSNVGLFLTLLLLYLLGGSLFYVWSRIQVIQLGYEISNALKEEKAISLTQQKLKLEIATLKSYARIERLATEELKMSKPKPDQVIVIR